MKKSTALFTPYGYKFEEADTYDRIYELYKDNRVEWSVKNPWMLSLNGYTEITNGRIQNVNSNGLQSHSTPVKDSSRIYSMLGNDHSTYPSANAYSWYGISVHGY